MTLFVDGMQAYHQKVLATYVQQSTGAKLPILSDDKKLAGTLISAGKLRYLHEQGIIGQ